MRSKGLYYRKVDLHIHTPASSCFFNTTDTSDYKKIAELIVSKAIEKGLAAVAITDHNTGEFIPFVQEVARGKSLTIFPGVEITVGDAKNHVIALLDKDKTIDNINDLLSKADIRSGDRGKKDAFSNQSVEQIVELITSPSFNGIASLAHCDSTNGVLKSMRGEPRTKVVQNPNLFCVEATNIEKTKTFLDGTDPTYKAKLAVYQASDNPSLKENGTRDVDGPNSGKHTIEGIGYKFTYFKLDENISLDSLKQCFFDPEVRIKIPDDFSDEIYPCINSVSVNSGFLKDVEIGFHDGLNSILGAKGVGKSLLIEFIRFALHQESENIDISKDHNSKLEECLGQYGEVDVELKDKTGNHYIVRRTFNPASDHPTECIEKDTGSNIHANISQLFPVLALSQNEIVKIVENRENELIKFIDKFFDFNVYRNEISIIENELDSLDREFATSVKAYTEKEKLKKAIKTAEIELTRLEKQLKNPLFKEIAIFENREKLFVKQMDFLESLKESLNSAIDDVKNEPIPEMGTDHSNFPPLQRNNDIITKAKSKLIDALSIERKDLDSSLKAVAKEYASWVVDYQKKLEELKEYIREVGGDIQAIELQRKTKNSELGKLRSRLELMEKKSRKLSEIAKQRKTKLSALSKVYDSYFNERKEKCDFFQRESNGKLSIDIEGASNRDVFKKSLMEIKSGSYFRENDVDKLSRSITPVDFVHDLLRYELYTESNGEQAEAEIKKLSEKTGFSADKIKKFCDYLIATIHSGEMEYETVLRLQYKAQPTDRPIIKYNVGTKERSNFKLLSKVSTGQKCTAMLILALSDGKMPILIDQPEDSLDIRGIWDDMCTKLRMGKDQRQFIFTTHNSSVAVASDTDQFSIITADDKKGELLFSGSMDEKNVRKEVVEYLEGGIKPYILKMLKYNYDPQEKKFN